MSTDNTRNETDFMDAISHYGGIINRICYYYSDNTDDFHDLRQDVLSTLWEASGNFKGLSSRSTWIYRITLNVCVSAFRKSTRRKKKERPIDTLPDIPDSVNILNDRLKMLQSLIHQLPQQDKAIILLWLDDVKYEEIAEITGLPRNTIATRLRRIKEKLSRIASNGGYTL